MEFIKKTKTKIEDNSKLIVVGSVVAAAIGMTISHHLLYEGFLEQAVRQMDKMTEAHIARM